MDVCVFVPTRECVAFFKPGCTTEGRVPVLAARWPAATPHPHSPVARNARRFGPASRIQMCRLLPISQVGQMPLKQPKRNAALRPREADLNPRVLRGGWGELLRSCWRACSARLRLRGPRLVFCEWISLPCPKPGRRQQSVPFRLRFSALHHTSNDAF